MDIINLPQDIFPEGKENPERVIIHDYSPPSGAFKGKSILHKNAISLVIKGEKTMNFAEQTVFASDREFHFLSAGNCVVTMNVSFTKPFRSILIFFDTSVWTSFYTKYAMPAGKISEHEKTEKASYLSFTKDPFTINFINSLQVLLQSGDQLSADMKMLKLEELWLYLLEKHPQDLLSFDPCLHKNPDEISIRKVVLANITNNMSLSEMAFLCHMSLSTFKRRFIKLYGKGPNEWFLEERMKIAKDLLQQQQEKPSQVYDKVGYESHSSFSQAFRKVYGKTPSEFQLEYLND
jgi:AraC-like DNA-binding protein